jgi:hypothetical protein
MNSYSIWIGGIVIQIITDGVLMVIIDALLAVTLPQGGSIGYLFYKPLKLHILKSTVRTLPMV